MRRGRSGFDRVACDGDGVGGAALKRSLGGVGLGAANDRSNASKPGRETGPLQS